MVFGATGGRDVTLHIGLRGQRLPQGQNGPFWGGRNTMERDVLMLVQKSDVERLVVLSLFVSKSEEHAWGCVFSTQMVGRVFE